MSLAMDPTASPRRELTSTIVGQLDDGLERLDALIERPDEVDTEKTVHSVRKRCKEVRGLAQLARPAVGGSYREFNALVRDAARELSALRDAQALLGTVDTLRSVDPAPSLDTVHDILGAAAEHTEGAVLDTPEILRDAHRQLIRARDLAEGWKLPKGFEAVEKGLTKTYARGQRALRHAREEGDDESFHDYRKATKQLWYQIRFLSPVAPTVLEPLIDQLDRMSDALGDNNDLAVLVEQLRADPDRFGGRKVVIAATSVIAVHRVILQQRALRSGATIYAESPGAFGGRIHTYWQTTRTRGEDRPLGGIADLNEPVGPDATDESGADHFERERKWLVAEVPSELPQGTRLRQGYLASTADLSLRVRDAGTKGCTVTIKSGSGSTRTELEWTIERDVFERLWPLTGDERVSKTRYELPSGGHTIELDVFDEKLAGLVYAEVEFTSEEEMTAYEAPAWFGDDVTEDGRYTNASLARHGLPSGS